MAQAIEKNLFFNFHPLHFTIEEEGGILTPKTVRLYPQDEGERAIFRQKGYTEGDQIDGNQFNELYTALTKAGHSRNEKTQK